MAGRDRRRPRRALRGGLAEPDLARRRHVGPERRGAALRRRRLAPGHPVSGQYLLHYLPELSPDGRAVFFLNLGGERPVLRLAATENGAPLDFELPLPLSDAGAGPAPGRCRWFPDGRSLAVLDRGAGGAYVGERYLLATRLGEHCPAPTLLAKEPGYAAESMGISPDDYHLVAAFWDSSSILTLGDDRPGIER